MAAAKAEWDEKHSPAKKFNPATGRMTRQKSFSFEKAWTWQLFLASACFTEHVGTPTEYSNGGSVKVAAHGGATPGGLAGELEKLVAKREKTGKYPDIQTTVTNLNGFTSKSGG